MIKHPATLSLALSLSWIYHLDETLFRPSQVCHALSRLLRVVSFLRPLYLYQSNPLLHLGHLFHTDKDLYTTLFCIAISLFIPLFQHIPTLI